MSKTRPPEAVREAFNCGLSAFGENYLSEALEKIEQLQDLPLEWHFIGPIQSNKTRPIAEHFDWVHSVERSKIARRLNDQRPAELPPLQVCIQVNISEEQAKSGLSLAQLPDLADEILSLPRLQLRGLMAIPAPSTDPIEQVAAFEQLQQALAELRNPGTRAGYSLNGYVERHGGRYSHWVDHCTYRDGYLWPHAKRDFAVRQTVYCCFGIEQCDSPTAARTSLLKKPHIAFIGAGNMASSIIGGLLESGHPRDRLSAADPFEPSRDRLRETAQIQVTADNSSAAASADVVILAVKPQVMAEALSSVAAVVQANGALVISIAAGITLASMEARLGDNTAIVRCMPNTPALLGCGASALYGNSAVMRDQHAYADDILGAVGITAWVEREEELDAITALSGSGPAYFFLFMEAMIDAGVKQGLDRDTATSLTLQTALGAARMAGESDVDLVELRRRVTSPGGTTERAVGEFESQGIRAMVDTAMSGAAERAAEMAKEMG